MKNKQIKTNSKKRSPLKNKPLRYAGKSIDEHIDNLFTDNFVPYLLISILCIALAGNEWMRFYINSLPSPKMMTFIALLVILFSYYKIKKMLREVKQLKLGREGERVVGEHLDILREKGYKIFHDIVGENINNNRGRVISLLSFISICKGEGRREVKDTITSGSTATGNSLCVFLRSWLLRRVSHVVSA